MTQIQIDKNIEYKYLCIIATVWNINIERKIIRHPRKYVFCKSGANCNLHRLDRPGGLPSPFWKQFQARIQPCIQPRIFFFMGPFWVPLPGLGIPRASGEPGWQGKSCKQLPMCVFIYVRCHGIFVKKKTLETEVSFNSFLRQIQRDIKSKPYSIAL